MKLRVRHNSLRLRLGRSEVEQLHEKQHCSEAICFPNGTRLEYSVESSSKTTAVAFAGDLIRVEVPADELSKWCVSDQVGLAAEIAVPEGPPLQVRIEKDFRCLDPDIVEDQSNTFENPLEKHAACDI